MSALVMIMCQLAMIFSILFFMRSEIRQALEKPPEIHTHYLLPKRAQCALKQMFLKNKDGFVQAVDRMVCHWEMK